MKKRLHDKKAGIAILISLIIISLAEVLFRSFVLKEAMLATANLGEQVAIIVLSVFIITMTLKGKDRICYICYGAWLGCFVFDQLFGLPGMIVNLAVYIGYPGTLPIIIRIIGMICIIAIGALLVEYMNDGTIHNRAFNTLCVITIVLYIISIGIGAFDLANRMPINISLDMFNKAKDIIMVFLFTFFAYDSAKMQLKKTNLTK
jgi:hypothetical protein